MLGTQVVRGDGLYMRLTHVNLRVADLLGIIPWFTQQNEEHSKQRRHSFFLDLILEVAYICQCPKREAN